MEMYTKESERMIKTLQLEVRKEAAVSGSSYNCHPFHWNGWISLHGRVEGVLRSCRTVWVGFRLLGRIFSSKADVKKLGSGCLSVLQPGCLLISVLQEKYVDPEKALEAKERGNEQFRAGQWALAIGEYEEVSVG